MNGTKKSPFGKGKRAQGFGAAAEQDANPFGGQQPKSSQKFPPEGTAFGAPKVSPTNEKHAKQRQARTKKRAPVTSDEETRFASMPSTVASSRDDSSKAELAAATNLDGLCADMCSPTERELHIRVDELSVFEKCFPDQPGTERDMIIKRFQRSSADHKLDIPEEIRPLAFYDELSCISSRQSWIWSSVAWIHVSSRLEFRSPLSFTTSAGIGFE